MKLISHLYGSELADTNVIATNAYGWGTKFSSGSLQSLVVKLFGLTHLGSRIRNRILENILNKENFLDKNLFDAGCGIGLETVHLARRFNNVFGADIEVKKINQARKLAKENNIRNAFFLQADLTDTNFRNKKYDYVISLEVIEHVSSDKNFINTLSRLLKKDGSIIISFPSKTLLSKIAQRSLNHYKIGYNLKDFGILLKGTGLIIEKKYSFGKSLLGKMLIAIDFVFKKTIPLLSILFFPIFYPLLMLDYHLPHFGIPRGYVLVLKKIRNE